MSWVLYLVAILWTVFGILALISPQVIKKCYRKCMSSYWLWGIVALIFAYLLWRSAFLVSQVWFVQLLAILAGIKGILLIVLPKNKITQWVESSLRKSALFWRVWGVIILLLAWYLFSIIS